jgi:hypothetical protein
MRTLQSIPIAACAALIAIASLRADEQSVPPPPAPIAATVEDEPFSEVSCTGTNPAVVSDVLQLANEARETLTPLLNLGSSWRYPVHITVVDPDPVTGKSVHENVSVIAAGHTMRIEAWLPSDDPQGREFIQRQFVTAMLWEKYFKPDTTFTADTKLDVVPLWLLEGLREWLNDDPEHNREEIIKRAALAQRAPTLREVLGWTDLSNDRLLGLWQRAFCYYLVDCLLWKNLEGDRRADFTQWIESVTGPNPRSAITLFPTEMGWQRELLESRERSRNLVFTWDESAAELTGDETIALPKGKNGDDTRLCTIETVASFPRTKEIDSAIMHKIYELTALQLRVHPSWQPIIELYRFGLTALVRDKDPVRAAKYIHEAHARRAAEMDFHEKLIDYTNWYEVTQNVPTATSHFRTYFQAAQELDKVEADPLHPNPLRADLLKVESEF